MKTIFAAALGLSLAAGVPMAAGATAPNPAALDSLRNRIRRMVDEAKLPSLALAVAHDGRIVWEEGFGYADLERRRPATPSTVYSIASVSKPMTATGLLRLVDQRKVSLDRPANDYLGEGKLTGLAGDASGATVRRVLSHSAGLPLHYRFFYEGGRVARPTMTEAIARYAVIVYPPGKVYNYSNLDYGVIETIIARTSGQSFEDFMRDQVFLPLGMTTTSIGTGRGLADAAVRYAAGGAAIPYYDFDHRGASAVWTSARELARFAMAHLGHGPTVLRDTTRRLMQQVATPGDATQGYGLGWDIGTELGTRAVSHHGQMPGVGATLKLYPEHDLAIAVLTNTSSGVPRDVALALAEAWLPRPDTSATAAKAAGAAPAASPLQPALQGEWSGTVRTYDGARTPLDLVIRGDDVQVRLGGGDAPWTLLEATRFIDGIQVLWGAFEGAIPSEEARRFPHDILLSLWFDGTRLVGGVTAVTKDEPRTGAMSSYAELTRKPPGAAPHKP